MVLRVEEINVNHCFNVTYDFDRAGYVDVNPPTASRRKGENCPLFMNPEYHNTDSGKGR